MMCLFGITGKEAKNEEEYLKLLRKRISALIWLIIVGVITFAVALSNEIFSIIGNNSWLNGVYTGLGVGIVCAGILIIVKYKKMMKNETLLKEGRLKEQDERNRMISGMAVKAAATTVLVISYVAMLITGFYSRTIFYCFWGVVMIFGLAFLFFNKYYSKKL